MHQLLQTKVSGTSLSQGYGQSNSQRSISLNEIISLSSFEIVKHIRIPLTVYILMIIAEFVYMIQSPAQIIVTGDRVITRLLLESLTSTGVYVITIATFVLLFAQTIFIFFRGKTLKDLQSKGAEKQSQQQESNITYYLIKGSGIFLMIVSTVLSQLLIRIIPEQFSCDQKYEQGTCESTLRSAALYCSIAAIPLMLFIIVYSDFFITKLFPHQNVPWAAWNEKSRFLRNIYKILMISNDLFISDSYKDIVNFAIMVVAIYIIYERYMIPSVYNRVSHIVQLFFEAQLLIYCSVGFFVAISGVMLSYTAVVFITIAGLIFGVFLMLAIDKKEKDIISIGTDLKNYNNLFDVELYLVMMLHELEKLIQSEEYGQEKHIHAIISRHMEECNNDSCPCKNYEPEYDKKFTSIGSKRISKMLSHAGSLGKQASSITDLKRLPYKITYKTKVEIFKKEFEDRIDKFLEAYPKSYGIKLLKSFFNHKYCESSFKALFVQLENAQTCKNFKGKVFIYHLKTQIQDEMNKSLESPLTVDINSLLRFEKFKMDFEKNLEDLSYHCQKFWTDLTKEEYKVTDTLETASTLSDKIMEIKNFFSKIVNINPLCIDASSTYALVYRYILRDESTFTDLVNRIQQIKNSAKLEQQREHGVRFFDSDIYALLMVSGDIKELGRIKQANSSTRFIFGYDPRDLIGSRINKIMPGPFSQIHDKFLTIFLSKGKSNFLERNQPLPVITKDGYLQMTLFYVKPQVSLKYGLVFSTFAKILNKYKLGDDSIEYQKMNKLCIILTDVDGFIHGMSDTCSNLMGLPPPAAGKQLYINDNQILNVQQICPQILQQEYEFELIKGVNMQVDTTFLNKERQFRREYPDIACKIGIYQAEVGIHKFQYRDFKSEINIFVIKIQEKDDFKFRQQLNDLDDSMKSKSNEDELTYSEFSITTANSSVISSQVATSKFKTFKSKIQSMTKPSQIILFQRLSFITFFLLLGIAACNFAINLIKNHSFMINLDVLTSLQHLIQLVPESAHSSRQLILLSNNLTQTGNDEIIRDYYTSKYDYYSQSLSKASTVFEYIQKQLNTDLKSLIQMDSYDVQIVDMQTDGDIKAFRKSMQTALNLFSSKILKLSTQKAAKFEGIIVPNISFQWSNFTKNRRNNEPLIISEIQQELYFVIENGLSSIVDGLMQIEGITYENTSSSSQEAAMISIILAGVSIVLVLVLLPMNYSPLTHLEKISQLILMSLNRLPEIFCQNETKACIELIMFLNEQKYGEKSTHQMIKKHDHRKQNRALLKLPKHKKKDIDGTGSSQSYESDSNSDIDRSTLLQSTRKKVSNYPPGDSASTDSRASATASVTSSKVTQLSRVRANQNQYETQQASQLQKVKRNEGGNIELDLAHAKTSELLDDENENNENAELTEAEIKQRDREYERKQAIIKTFRRIKLKKFGCIIVTAFIIAIYYAITCFYLNLAHQYEKIYLDDYSLIGQRIQCYSNVASYVIDSLARNSNITVGTKSDAANKFVNDCFKTEQRYKSLILEGLSSTVNIDTFNELNSQFDRELLCQTLATKKQLNLNSCQTVVNGLLRVGLPETLFHFLRNMQNTLLLFDDKKVFPTEQEQLLVLRNLLMKDSNNILISLHQIYLKSAFQILREESLAIIQGYFNKLNSYYNMLFGLFVGLLTLFQTVVSFYLVKKLSKQIVKMYHVVLMVPFSGRTQNDLNRLMMIKL